MQFTTYNVTLRLNDRLVGGIPIVPDNGDRADAYEKWARGQDAGDTPGFDQTLPEALAQDPDMPVAVEDVEGLETGFKRDDDGLYIECRQVKAMIRESAQRLGLIKSKRGMRDVLQHDLRVRSPRGDQKLHLGRHEPDGKESRPISVVTRQGPRTALKRYEYVNEAELQFAVVVLNDGVAGTLLAEDDLRAILVFGEGLGLGADRSQGEGTYTLVSLEQIGEAEA
jgi:hypothetical protein